MNGPEILKVGWGEVEAWLRKLAGEREFDTIVGVTRCGLPIAAALSALVPHASVAVLSRRGPRGAKAPCYDFAADRHERLDALRRTFELTSLPEDASRVLIVDDVATYGDTLHVADQKVRARLPDARINFACFAADEGRLRAARPEILERLHYQIAIDNSRVWVSFPWNLDPLSDKT
jgi:hypoxanthine phosphoribosyltransferase